MGCGPSADSANTSEPGQSKPGPSKPGNVPESIFEKHDKEKGNAALTDAEVVAFLKEAFPQGVNNDKAIDDMKQVIAAECHDGTVHMNELRAFLRMYHPENKHIKLKTALIIIDVQNDFITGTLANPYKAVDIVPIINGMRDKFDFVVISLDWHPNAHCSFVESANEGTTDMVDEKKEFTPFSMITLKGDSDRAEHQQMLYPRHGVQGTEGSETHKDLVMSDKDGRIYKGTKPNIDSYSAFFDNCKANDTGLTAMLQKEGVTDIYCCGLVFDICVKSTALHGAEMGFHVSVIEDACRPLDKANVEATKKQLDDAGVNVVTADDALKNMQKKDYTMKEYLTFVRKGKGAKAVHSELGDVLSSHSSRNL